MKKFAMCGNSEDTMVLNEVELKSKVAENPQERLEMSQESSETSTRTFRRIKNTDLAYVAGILDADGHFTSSTSGDGYSSMYVGVSSSTRGLVDWLKSMFGGNIQAKAPSEWQNFTCYQWRPGNTKEFLKLMKPYLRMKRPHMEVALAFFSLPHAPKKRNRLAEKVQRLNEDRVQYSWRHE